MRDVFCACFVGCKIVRVGKVLFLLLWYEAVTFFFAVSARSGSKFESTRFSSCLVCSPKYRLLNLAIIMSLSDFSYWLCVRRTVYHFPFFCTPSKLSGQTNDAIEEAALAVHGSSILIPVQVIAGFWVEARGSTSVCKHKHLF